MSLLVIYRGSAASLPFAVTNPDGTPFDLTGKTLDWQAKFSPGDVSAFIAKSTSSSGISVDSPPTLGTGSVAIAATDTAALTNPPNCILRWEFSVRDSGGKPVPLNAGDLLVWQNIIS